MKIFGTFVLSFICLHSFAQTAVPTKQIKITPVNLESFAIGERLECDPDQLYWGKYGFDTTITIKNEGVFVARMCMDGPVGYRNAREAMLKNLIRIQGDELSFEKNASQIVCFKTRAILETASKVITFNQSLTKCP